MLYICGSQHVGHYPPLGTITGPELGGCASHWKVWQPHSPLEGLLNAKNSSDQGSKHTSGFYMKLPNLGDGGNHKAILDVKVQIFPYPGPVSASSMGLLESAPAILMA